jgi:FMN reductase
VDSPALPTHGGFAVTVLAINASPSASSKTAVLVAAAVDAGGGGRVIHLGELDADGLLGRRPSAAVRTLLDDVVAAPLLLWATPIFRATYSGLLKVVFDQLPSDALAGSVSILAATAGGPTHYLSLDTGLRSLVASLAGWSTPSVVYSASSDFTNGEPNDAVREQMATAFAEAATISGTRHTSPAENQP